MARTFLACALLLVLPLQAVADDSVSAVVAFRLGVDGLNSKDYDKAIEKFTEARRNDMAIMKNSLFGLLVVGGLLTTTASADDSKDEAINKTASKSKAHGESSPSKLTAKSQRKRMSRNSRWSTALMALGASVQEMER